MTRDFFLRSALTLLIVGGGFSIAGLRTYRRKRAAYLIAFGGGLTAGALILGAVAWSEVTW